VDLHGYRFIHDALTPPVDTNPGRGARATALSWNNK
jgi:hypothetical protein